MFIAPGGLIIVHQCQDENVWCMLNSHYTPRRCHVMAEPAIDTVFASTISLLRVLQGFEKQISDIQELQDQVRALSTVLLLIDGTDHIVKIDDQLKQPLLRPTAVGKQ